MTNSRDKGKRGEREAAKELRDLGFEARRGQQFSGLEGEDIVTNIEGVHFEVKRTEKLSLYEAMAQSSADSVAGEVPVVMHRRSHKPWLVIFELEDLHRFINHVSRARDRSNEENE